MLIVRCEFCNVVRMCESSQEKYYWNKKHQASKRHKRNAALKQETENSRDLSVNELQIRIAELDTKDDLYSQSMRNILRRFLSDKQRENGELFK